MLTERKENILKIIIGEYVPTAVPVGSMSIARKHQLGISPATIRSEMAELEEDGFITHPHTSAGRIPSDKGYRYFVEALMEEVQIPLLEQLRIRHQFHQVEHELEQWMSLASVILAQMVTNAAVVTLPKATICRFKHLELVVVQEFLAMLILVLQEAKLKQHMLPLDESISQEELSAIANKLNYIFSGLSSAQIETKKVEFTPVEEQVRSTTVKIMQAEDEKSFDDMYLNGLRHIFRQPEFAKSKKMLDLVELLDDRRALGAILLEALSGEGAQVVIGTENREDAMRECSMVMTRYGVSGELKGVLGVIGPTRMRYSQTISMVRFLSTLLDELLSELC